MDMIKASIGNDSLAQTAIWQDAAPGSATAPAAAPAATEYQAVVETGSIAAPSAEPVAAAPETPVEVPAADPVAPAATVPTADILGPVEREALALVTQAKASGGDLTLEAALNQVKARYFPQPSELDNLQGQLAAVRDRILTSGSELLYGEEAANAHAEALDLTQKIADLKIQQGISNAVAQLETKQALQGQKAARQSTMDAVVKEFPNAGQKGTILNDRANALVGAMNAEIDANGPRAQEFLNIIGAHNPNAPRAVIDMAVGQLAKEFATMGIPAADAVARITGKPVAAAPKAPIAQAPVPAGQVPVLPRTVPVTGSGNGTGAPVPVASAEQVKQAIRFNPKFATDVFNELAGNDTKFAFGS